MLVRSPSRKPASEYTPIPSEQMIIRRYRSISSKRDLHTYFSQGLFCNHLPEFDDKNEGILQYPGGYGNLRGALAASSLPKRRQEGGEVETASDEEFDEALDQFHRDARHQHFANCWRIGTDEKDRIWKDYTRDSAMVEGCALETTVGQLLRALPSWPAVPDQTESFDPTDITETPEWDLSLQAENCDIRFGACKYQQDDNPIRKQPSGWTAAISFFKGEDFEDEMEFRVLINPFSDNLFIDTAPNGTPQTFRPDIGEDSFRKLPTATRWMTNRIVLAPDATQEEREKVEEWLSEFDIETGSSPAADIEIIESTDTGSPLEDNYEYTAELAGLANYDGSVDHLETAMEQFLTKRDWEKWPVVDLVEISTDKAGTFIEAYWHRSEEPVFEMSSYGHHEFQRVWVRRFTDPTEEPVMWKNRLAEEYEEEIEE